MAGSSLPHESSVSDRNNPSMKGLPAIARGGVYRWQRPAKTLGKAVPGLMRELTELRSNPPEGIRVVTNEENMLDVTGIIAGPGVYILLRVSWLWLIRSAEGTPYAGGYFRVKFRFTEEFPAAPPKCTF